MKVKCIRTDYWPDSYQCDYYGNDITREKIYDSTPSKFKNYWCIINDSGEEVDIPKDCFSSLREINLDILIKDTEQNDSNMI